MGKIRNYVYGSPKFEGEINKAVPPEGSDIKSTGVLSGKVLTADGSGGASWEDAGGGSLYRHKVGISARDANYTTYFFEILLYSSSATPFFDEQQTPSITDVVNFITPLLNEYFVTPAFINEGTEYHFELIEDGIEGTSLVFNTGVYNRSTITNITDAYDIVAEV